jgi:hypothetical protein
MGNIMREFELAKKMIESVRKTGKIQAIVDNVDLIRGDYLIANYWCLESICKSSVYLVIHNPVDNSIYAEIANPDEIIKWF